jgi:hypothetical protein
VVETRAPLQFHVPGYFGDSYLLTPDRLVRFVIEIIFILLGGLVVWLGVTGQIFFDRRGTSWLTLSLALMLWGLYALYKPGRAWLPGERWTRGLSLTLLGAILLILTRVPFLWVGKLFALAGLILILRGLAGTLLILRPR